VFAFSGEKVDPHSTMFTVVGPKARFNQRSDARPSTALHGVWAMIV